ncbi:MAG: cytochrome c oxidase subunit II [Bacteroidota bacterium]
MQIEETAPTRQEFFTGENGLWLPPQESTTAHQIDSLFNFILYSSTILTLIVAAAMVYFIYKYRRKSHADRAVDVHESKWLEVSWIAIPTLLVLVVFFWGFTAYVNTSIPPANSYEISVTGQKWDWSFEYPNGKQTVKEIVVPVNTPIKLEMTSIDVLHSFYVPEFRIKHDVIPNRYSYVWFEAPEQGVYQVLCTEYCGTLHSDMGALIKVVSYDDFATWLASGDGEDLSLVAYGEVLYEQQGCNACHSIDGSDGTGPTWLGTWGEQRPFEDGTSAVMDAEYTIESILYPGNKIVQGYPPAMASYQGRLDERQLNAIVAYMKDLNGAATPEELAPPGEGGDTGDGTEADAPPADDASETPAVEA